MHRRGFLAALLVPIVARFVPKPPISEQFAPRWDEDIQVLNKGDGEIFAMIQKRMDDAMQEMSRILGEEMYRIEPRSPLDWRLSKSQRIFDPGRLPG